MNETIVLQIIPVVNTTISVYSKVVTGWKEHIIGVRVLRQATIFLVNFKTATAAKAQLSWDRYTF